MPVNRELFQKIDEYLAENRNVILEDLKTLARVPSILGTAEDDAPYGKPCLDVLKVATSLFDKAGCKTEICGNRYGLATYGDGEKTIGIFGHCDVVPVGEGWIYTEPFNPIEKDGFMIGRGVSDNKAGVTMSLYVIKALEALGIKLNSKVVCYLGAAEETGMSDIDAFVKEQKMPDVSIVPDGSFPVGRGEKGICRFWAKSSVPFKAIKSFKGGSAYNVVLDDVTVKFESDDKLYNELSEKTSGKKEFALTKDDGEICLNVRGITKHAASPDGSLNAAWIAADLLKDVEALPDSDRKVLTYAAHILDGYYGVNLNISDEDPNFGKLTCVNGMVDLEEGKLGVSFDIRFGVSTNSKVMTETLNKTISENEWSFDLKECEDGFFLETDGNPQAEAMLNVYKEVSGNQDATWTVMAGGTYARRLKNAYSMGTQVPYKRRRPDLPEGHGGSHQCDESLTIEAFMDAIKILILSVIECDKTL